jgi:peptidoglycan-associated lipoprotein
MKATVKLTTLLMGVVFMLVLVGCPKKCVKPVAEEPVMVEPPVEEKTEEKPAEAKAVTINLQTIYFDFDKYDIRTGDAQILQENAQQIKNALNGGQKLMVTIEGHCCPIGTAEYNMALGQRRAEAAKSYLVKLGVDAGILSTISYGEERLVTTDPNQYHLNRRCEFKTQGK